VEQTIIVAKLIASAGSMQAVAAANWLDLPPARRRCCSIAPARVAPHLALDAELDALATTQKVT
jgi:hypothetical protein